MRGFILLSTITLIVTPSVAWPQASPVVPGVRIRITQSGIDGPEIRGTVVTRSADTVLLKLDRGGKTVPISLARVSTMEVSRGRKGHALAGMGIGFLAGAGAGALMGALTCEGSSTCTGGSDGSLTTIYTLLFAGIGGGVGAVVGGVIGAAHRSEQWEPVPARQWSLRISPGREGGFALGVSVRF